MKEGEDKRERDSEDSVEGTSDIGISKSLILSNHHPLFIIEQGVFDTS